MLDTTIYLFHSTGEGVVGFVGLWCLSFSDISLSRVTNGSLENVFAFVAKYAIVSENAFKIISLAFFFVNPI